MIPGFLNNMEQNGSVVTNAKEAPFVVSQLFSKLDTKDNIEFSHEMHHMENEENVLNLIDWLNSEASLWSSKDVGKDADIHNNSGIHKILQKSDHPAINNETSHDDVFTRLRSETSTFQMPKNINKQRSISDEK